MRRVSTIFVLLASCVLLSAAEPPTPSYIAIGDSVEFGIGDGVPGDGFGYVPLVSAFLAEFFQEPVDTDNFGTPGATTREILLEQVPDALAAAQAGGPVVVSWGGGGNDLGNIALGPQAAVCRRTPSCFGRIAAALNEAEVAITLTIARLRLALGPQAVILMRTGFNNLLKTGCATADEAAIATAALEGVPGTVLRRGLNTRIRDIAATFDAQVVDTFLPFAVAADALISADCGHPSGAGYVVIGDLSAAAFADAQ